MNSTLVGGSLLAWWVATVALTVAFAVSRRIRGARLIALIAVGIAIGALGIVGRDLVKITFRGLANDASIAVLTIVLTVVGAYGVYVAQRAETVARNATQSLRLIESERLKLLELENDLRAALAKQSEELSRAQTRGRILSLKQTILAGMPIALPETENAEAHMILKRIVLDALSRDDPSSAKFDCDEAVEVAGLQGIDLADALGKGQFAFYEYRRLATIGANSGGWE
jgi:hypothetical protein